MFYVEHIQGDKYTYFDDFRRYLISVEFVILLNHFDNFKIFSFDISFYILTLII